MIKIKKLKIENFQSHVVTELEFSDGFNIIFGPSDYGKSAIIRALKWVLYNEPRGIDFIRHGATFAKVTMELSNDHTIVRERSQSKNKYVLIYPDGHSMLFEGFGNEIPEEVIKAHGIPKYELDNDSKCSLNIAEQLDGPFLLSETGAVRAKAIGRLIGLHIIDKAIRNCNVDIRRENQSEEKTRSDLSDIESKLEEYKHLKTIEERLQASELLINQIENKILRTSSMEALNKEFTAVNVEYKNIKGKYDRLDKLKECEIDLKSCEIDLKNLDKLVKIKNVSREIKLEILDLSTIIEKSSGLHEYANVLNDIIKNKNVLEKLTIFENSYKKIEKEIGSADKQLENTKNNEELEQLLKTSKEKSSRLLKIESVSEGLNEILLKSKKMEKVLSYSNNIDGYSEIIENINQKLDLLNKIEGAKEQLETKDNKIYIGNKFIQNNQIEIDNYSSKYIEMLKEAGKCPLCGNKISNDVLNEILRET